jgi:hypothetical protein
LFAFTGQTREVNNVQPSCELCEAAQITPWFRDDELCWVAECEACEVPMVVWKVHDPCPPDDIKQELHRRLGEIITEHFAYEHYIDDNLRSIPTHYHAHARPRGRFPARGPVPRQHPPE